MSVFGRLFRNPQAVVGFAMIVLLLLAAVIVLFNALGVF